LVPPVSGVRFVPIADIASLIDRIFDLDQGKQQQGLLTGASKMVSAMDRALLLWLILVPLPIIVLLVMLWQGQDVRY